MIFSSNFISLISPCFFAVICSEPVITLFSSSLSLVWQYVENILVRVGIISLSFFRRKSTKNIDTHKYMLKKGCAYAGGAAYEL